VDVRDVAEFLVLAIDRSIYGAFNLTGRAMMYREFLNACKSATHSDSELVWIPLDYLRMQGILPEDFPSLRSLHRIHSESALY
jgi:nucleoside-diphosphate-sugar epimerase